MTKQIELLEAIVDKLSELKRSQSEGRAELNEEIQSIKGLLPGSSRLEQPVLTEEDRTKIKAEALTEFAESVESGTPLDVELLNRVFSAVMVKLEEDGWKLSKTEEEEVEVEAGKIPTGIVRAYRKAQKAKAEYYTTLPTECLEGKQVGQWIEGVIWELKKLYPKLEEEEEEVPVASPVSQDVRIEMSEKPFEGAEFHPTLKKYYKVVENAQETE